MERSRDRRRRHRTLNREVRAAFRSGDTTAAELALGALLKRRPKNTGDLWRGLPASARSFVTQHSRLSQALPQSERRELHATDDHSPETDTVTNRENGEVAMGRYALAHSPDIETDEHHYQQLPRAE